MMKQAVHPKKSLIIILTLVFLLFAAAVQAWLNLNPVSAAQPPSADEAPGQSAPSFAAPSPEQAKRYSDLEAAILAATVRLELEIWAPQGDGSYKRVDVSIGHATVMGGRFLVTHNHFSLSLENVNDGYLRELSAYRADGRAILKAVPFDAFEVLATGPETLVFDFGTFGSQGALAQLGLASARFANGQTLDLGPGTEVAQVNWDGQRTFVNWVRVLAVRLENGTPVVELDNYPEQGASGGGLFLDGVHLGNNWFRGRDRQTETGEVLRHFAVAALNQAELLALGEVEPGHDLTASAPEPTTGASLPQLGAAEVLPE